MVTLAAKRAVIYHLQKDYDLSQRRACRLIGCHRKTARHVSLCKEYPALRERLREFTLEKKRWGYRMLGGALRLEGWSVNHKRLYRINKEETLDLRLRCEKRGRAVTPTTINEVWNMDFTSDALGNGRSSHTLNVIDIFTRPCLAIEIDTSLTGERVVRARTQLIHQLRFRTSE